MTLQREPEGIIIGISLGNKQTCFEATFNDSVLNPELYAG